MLSTRRVHPISPIFYSLSLTFFAACFSSGTLEADGGVRDAEVDTAADATLRDAEVDASRDAITGDAMPDGTVADALSDGSSGPPAFSDLCSVEPVPSRSFLDDSWRTHRTSVLAQEDGFVIWDGLIEYPVGNINVRWFQSALDAEGNLGEGVEFARAESIVRVNDWLYLIEVTEDGRTLLRRSDEGDIAIPLPHPSSCDRTRDLRLVANGGLVFALGRQWCEDSWSSRVYVIRGTEVVDFFDSSLEVRSVVALGEERYLVHSGPIFLRSSDGTERLVDGGWNRVSPLEEGGALVVRHERSGELRFLEINTSGAVEELGSFDIGEERLDTFATKLDGDILVTLLSIHRGEVRFGLLRDAEFSVSEPFRSETEPVFAGSFRSLGVSGSFFSHSPYHEYLVRCER